MSSDLAFTVASSLRTRGGSSTKLVVFRPRRNKDYDLLNPKQGAADAIMYVVGDRINPPAAQIISRLVRAGKVHVSSMHACTSLGTRAENVLGACKAS